MNVFDDYTRQLLTTLNSKKVEYLVVGGYAVNYHGYRRTTGDIDIWIKPDNGINKQQLIDCLHILNVEQGKLNVLKEWDFSKPVVFIDGEAPFKIDFMTYVTGVEFKEAYTQKVVAELDGIEIPFINFQHLVKSKFSTSRTKDKMDIEMLLKIKQMKGKG